MRGLTEVDKDRCDGPSLFMVWRRYKWHLWNMNDRTRLFCISVASIVMRSVPLSTETAIRSAHQRCQVERSANLAIRLPVTRPSLFLRSLTASYDIFVICSMDTALPSPRSNPFRTRQLQLDLRQHSPALRPDLPPWRRKRKHRHLLPTPNRH